MKMFGVMMCLVLIISATWGICLLVDSWVGEEVKPNVKEVEYVGEVFIQNIVVGSPGTTSGGTWQKFTEDDVRSKVVFGSREPSYSITVTDYWDSSIRFDRWFEGGRVFFYANKPDEYQELRDAIEEGFVEHKDQKWGV